MPPQRPQTNSNARSLESRIWDATCSMRGFKDAPRYKDCILPLSFTKRLRDVFDDEVNRIAAEVGVCKKAFRQGFVDHDLRFSSSWGVNRRFRR